MLSLIGLTLLLTGCNQDKGINQLNEMNQLESKYTVIIDLGYGETSTCDFDNDEFSCTNGDITLTHEDLDLNSTSSSFYFLHLLPEDFDETWEDRFQLTEQGRRDFVQRLGFIQAYLNEDEHSQEDIDNTIDKALEGFGTVVLIVEDNNIKSITLSDESDIVVITYTFDFE